MDTPTQENQHEFFPDFVKPSERKAEPRVAGIGRTQKPILFTTTVEQILFASIVAILVLCGVFFLGILRGKSLGPSQQVSIRPAQAARSVSAVPAAVRPAPTPVRPTQAQASAPVSRTVRVAAPAAAVPAPVMMPSSTPAAGKRLYTIQVVTHKKRAFAEGELAAIGRTGLGGKIIESDGYFIVCVGQYAAKEDAQKDLSFLKAKYADCFLRRL